MGPLQNEFPRGDSAIRARLEEFFYRYRTASCGQQRCTACGDSSNSDPWPIFIELLKGERPLSGTCGVRGTANATASTNLIRTILMWPVHLGSSSGSSVEGERRAYKKEVSRVD